MKLFTSLRFLLSLVALLVLATASSARGNDPSTPPSSPVDERWQRTAREFAWTLLDGSTDFQGRRFLVPNASISRVDLSGVEGIDHLRRALAGSSILGGSAYIGTPRTMARDIAAECTKLPNLPATFVRKMTPSSEENMRRADAIAANWFSLHMNVAETDSVAVLVFVRVDETRSTDTAGREATVLFVLLRGVFEQGEWKITHVRYGNPLAVAGR